MNLYLKSSVLFSFAALSGVSFAATLQVPEQFPQIQSAIDRAQNGDIISVAPGIYAENLLITNKSVTVSSTGGAEKTIIDGRKLDSVIRIKGTGKDNPTIVGFTIKNGQPSSGSTNGGGVSISNAEAVLLDNIITGNQACSGAGIDVYFAAPVIARNQITNNSQAGCSGGIGGAAIAYGGDAGKTGYIIQNVISNNTTSSNGGALSLFASGKVDIYDNIMRSNSANQGGAISIANGSPVLIANNAIYNNKANQGGGIYSSTSAITGLQIVNNFIYGNSVPTTTGGEGAATYTSGFSANMQIQDNILEADSTSSTLYCDGTYEKTPPKVSGNVITNTGSGVKLGGVCASVN